jgi:hypothetical protein
MAKLRLFAPENLWSTEDGALTALSEASGLPAAASQSPDRTYIYRSLSQIANQTLIRDVGTNGQTLSCIGMANTKRMNEGTVRLYQGGNGASPGAWVSVVALPPEDSTTRVAYAFFTPVIARWWKLEWENFNDLIADYAEVGYVFLGAPNEFSRGVVVPVPIGRTDPSVARASVDGQESYVQRSGSFFGSFMHRNASEADLTAMRQIYLAVGRRTPIFAVLDSTIGWQAWLLRFASDVSHPRRSVPGRYDISYSWREAV